MRKITILRDELHVCLRECIVSRIDFTTRDFLLRRRRPRGVRFLPTHWEFCESRTLLSFTIQSVTIEGPRPGQPQAFANFVVVSNPPNIEYSYRVDYSTSDGSALSGRDYLATSGTLLFPPDSGPQIVSVPITAERRDTTSQSFSVTLSNPRGTTISVGQATGTIHTTPGLTIQGSSVDQPSSGTTPATFTLGLYPPSDVPVTVNYATSDVTAQAGRDYQSTSGTLRFAPGELAKTVNVSVLGGTLNISTRTFHLDLSGETNSIVLDPRYGLGTVLDTHPAGSVSFASSSFAQVEDGGQATITLNRTSGIASGVSVDFSAVSGGTAIAGQSYIPTSGTVYFAAGQSTATFTIPVLDNLIVETDRTLPILLTNPQGGAALAPVASANLTIVNVDSLVVTNTSDSGRGSFRKSILSANATPGLNTVVFALPNLGPTTFSVNSALPTLTKPGGIDGTTQPGYSGIPLIILDGTNGGPGLNGVVLSSGSSTIRGLSIQNFAGSGLLILGPGGNLVERNDLGPGNRGDGLTIQDSSGNSISANLISGNLGSGAAIHGLSSSANTFQANKIGTDRTGKSSQPNGAGGLYLDNTSNNLIGGDTPSFRNLISGNTGSGIQLRGLGAHGNSIQGNFVGVDVSGSLALGNSVDGISLDQASSNLIGGSTLSAANIISANTLVGIRINRGGQNLVQNNRVGTTADGSRGLGTQVDGIYLSDSSNNAIIGNLLSGNLEVGIQVHGPLSSGNLIQSNYVGTDSTGTKPVRNGLDGVFINDSPRNTITYNVISGNGSIGLQLLDTFSKSNVVTNNIIGGDAAGKIRAGLGNLIGLFLNVVGAGNNIGGKSGPGRNTIVGNRQADRLTNNARNGAYVTSLDSSLTNGQLSRLVLSFNRALDVNTAQNLANYRLASLAVGGQILSIASSKYDEIQRSVTLTLSNAIRLTSPISLTASGLLDRAGRPIDGNSSGQSGGSYVATISPTPGSQRLTHRNIRRR